MVADIIKTGLKNEEGAVGTANRRCKGPEGGRTSNGAAVVESRYLVVPDHVNFRLYMEAAAMAYVTSRAEGSTLTKAIKAPRTPTGKVSWMTVNLWSEMQSSVACLSQKEGGGAELAAEMRREVLMDFAGEALNHHHWQVQRGRDLFPSLAQLSDVASSFYFKNDKRKLLVVLINSTNMTDSDVQSVLLNKDGAAVETTSSKPKKPAASATNGSTGGEGEGASYAVREANRRMALEGAADAIAKNAKKLVAVGTGELSGYRIVYTGWREGGSMAQYLTHGRGKLGLFGISFNAAGAYNFATVDGSRKVTNCINFMDCEGACLPLVFFTFLFLYIIY